MLGKIEELKLISQCVLFDDRNAFGVLVEEYQRAIRGFFLNLTSGDVLLSEDLSQDTFIKAYVNLRSFKGISKFKTWLYRIAYNEYYDYMRKRHEEKLNEDYTPEEMGHPIDNADAKMDVKTCLQSLSEMERAVVTLFYMEDQPLKKISEITRLPEGTIKSHLSRAKSKMARVLKQDI